jgi:hypothetical protein
MKVLRIQIIRATQMIHTVTVITISVMTKKKGEIKGSLKKKQNNFKLPIIHLSTTMSNTSITDQIIQSVRNTTNKEMLCGRQEKVYPLVLN